MSGNRYRRNGRQVGGFTLIELVVVMTIIGLLVGIAIPAYRRTIQRAKEAVLKENLWRTRDAINQYYADNQEYPKSLQDLVDKGYLRSLPYDPITQSTDTWILIYEEPDPNNPAYEPGIIDIQSGAEGVDSQGVPYRDY